MEYTKDIILEVKRKKGLGMEQWKNWTSRIKKESQGNKIMMITVSLLSILMAIDMILVYSFLQLFSKVY